MKKILLFFIDIPPLIGVGTSGGGFRAWSIYEGLKSAGFDVIPSIPKFQYLSKKYWDRLDDECKANSWERRAGDQERVIDEVDPDVIVYSSNYSAYNINENLEIPVVIDLHGPTLMESYFFKGDLSYSDFSMKTNKLSKGDYYIFVNRRQRHYFSGWLLMSGILLDKRYYGEIPVSLSPNIPQINQQARLQKRTTFVYGGGFFPWQDPTTGIDILTEILKNKGSGELLLFTESHKISKSDTDRFRSFARRLEHNSAAKFKGIIPRDDLLKEYGRANVAMDLMSRNLERELAFTTRTVEYLWTGLPVIYNNYSELSDYISRYKAGWCIDPEDHDEINETIEYILDNPAEVNEYGFNAQRLVRENFTWDVTMQPLINFCNNPKKRE